MPENEGDKRHSDAPRRRVLLAASGDPAGAGIREWISFGGYEPVKVHGLAEAVAAAASGAARVAVVDMQAAAGGGMDDLHRLVTMPPRVRCILTAAPAAVPEAIRMVGRGAFACLRQPVIREELLAMLARCFETLRLADGQEKAEAAQALLGRKLRGETQRANQARAALERTEREYRHLVQSLPEVFYRTDPAGVITMISPSVTPVLGYPADDVLG
ncbi:MAG TPA: hypothetical protein VLT88_17380, partial [Desulfosarcina sp.]|nr:hypothetical protein [Desulfosarcina sp.]